MCENKEAEVVDSIEKVDFTPFKVIRFNKTWAIENFKRCTQYESPIFSIGQLEKIYWRFKLYSGMNNGYPVNTDCVYPALTLLPCDISKMSVKYTCHVVDSNGRKLLTLETQSFQNTVSATDITEYSGQKSSDVRKCYIDAGDDSQRRLLGRSNFFILYEVELSLPWNEFNVRTEFFDDREPKCDLGADISKVLANNKFSDFTINVGGKEFLVHKNILSARSRVFEAMFEHEMAEKENNLAEVTDIEPEVFHEMLRFMYTGKVENLETMADKLLSAAEKYELPRLKLISERALYAAITVSNAADMLLLSQLYNGDYLKKQAIRFISKLPLSKFVETGGFRRLTESVPTLMADILLEMSKYKAFN